MKNILMLAASACAVCAFGAAPKTYYVSTNGLHEVEGVVWGTYVTDDGVAHDAYTDLQQAVDGATWNDTIWVEDGFVCDSGVSGHAARIDLDFYKGGLTIRSRSGDWRTGAEIRGQYNSPEQPCGANSVRCFYSNAENMKLIGFRLVGGSSSAQADTVTGANERNQGGCVFFTGYSGTLENCLVADGISEGAGGGVRGGSDANGPILLNCVFTNNWANGNGGAVRCSRLISNCIFTDNICTNTDWSLGNGGGACDALLVSNCVFRRNQAFNPTSRTSGTRQAGNGGGLYSSTGNGQAFGCVFADNYCTCAGGAIANFKGGVSNVVLRNTSTYGGAVWKGGWTDCLIVSNLALYAGTENVNISGGGATAITGTNLVLRGNLSCSAGGGAAGSTLYHCKVIDNVASNSTAYGVGSGGGLYGGTATDCLIAGNVAKGADAAKGELAHGAGGGTAGSAVLYGCVVSNNTGWARGGGMSGGSAWNCIIIENRAYAAGGGASAGSGSSFYGTLFVGNVGNQQGGIFAYGVPAYPVVNCTFTANTNMDLSGTVVRGSVLSLAALTNSVVWANRNITDAAVPASALHSHSCYPTATEGENGNTAQDPHLWTFNGKAYAAIFTSCRGQGETFEWMTDEADIRSKDKYGDPRILGDGPDMGWVSMPSGGVVCRSASFGPLAATIGSLFSLTARIDTVKAGATYDFHWTLTDLEGVERRFIGTEEVLNQMIADPGDYKVSLVVSNRDDPDDFDIGILTDRLLVLPLTNYVTSVAGAKPVSPYARPETAATSVHDALDVAADGAVIVFDAGEHAVTKEIAVSRKLTLVGAGREATVLRAGASASKNYRVMSLDHAEAIVRDLTLTGGFTSGDGGSPYHGSAGLDIRANGGRAINCAIVGNTLSGGSTGRNGGGISIFNKDALVDRCIIAFNTNYHSAAGNKSVGIVYMNAGTVRNSIIRNNFLDGVGQTGSGHVVDMSYSVCKLENCTIVDNEDRFPDGCAVCMTGAYQNTPHMYNTILSGNTAPNATIPEDSPLPNLRATGASYYYDVQKCFFVGSAAFDAKSYVGTDAKFVDAAAGDYRLRIDSPCRSKGRNDDWMAGALDVYGKPRLAGRKVDIGAAETESGLMILVH